jgi:hypothetical protein
MPDSVIKRVESLADKEKQGDGIIFTDLNNNPIENDGGGDDEEDSATAGVYEEGNENEENENENEENRSDSEYNNLPAMVMNNETESEKKWKIMRSQE